MRPSHGKGSNGSSKFEVHTTEMGGWVAATKFSWWLVI